WHHADITVLPEPGTTSLRLFLYADGNGSTDNVTAYRSVAVVGESAAGLALAPLGLTRILPTVSYERTSPTNFRVHVRNAEGPFLLWLTETYAPGWKLITENGQAPAWRHVQVDGYANGWMIPRGGDFEVSLAYGPETLADTAKMVSLAVTVLLLLGLFVGIVLTVRRRRLFLVGSNR
ncbi:MAG: hypothetical protein LC723_01480, partial [Actinobacteria bacterium]|nr:hypothetical protein [Actinomycetota bacterium]